MQKVSEDVVNLLAVAGGRQEMAVTSTLNVGVGAKDGSLTRAIHLGTVQFALIHADSTYAPWHIADDATVHASLTIPYRSLEGGRGVIVLFLARHASMVSVTNPLWTRLADDFAVFLERRKNSVDIGRISGYQLAIADLLRDVLAVTHIASAYELVLSLLTSRAEARAAWIVDWDERYASVNAIQLVAVRGGQGADLAVKKWCADEGAGHSWLREVIATVKQTERAAIKEARTDARLRRWRDSETVMAQAAVVGAWPLWTDDGLTSVLFIASADAAYFSSSLQVFLHQVVEVLHIADQQKRNAVEIRRRTLLYQALLDEADAVLKMRAEQPLMEETCKRLVESTLFESAWLGRPKEKEACEIFASASVSSGVPNPGDASAQGLTKLERQLLQHAWQTGQVVFPSPETLIYSKEVADVPPIVLLPIFRNEKQWAILVVRHRTTNILSADLMGLLQRIASLLGRGLDEIDLKRQLAVEQNRQTWLATHDALTGLSNRRGLEDYFGPALLRAQRNKTLLAVVIMDLDDFKPVNDTYGHEVGDRLLKAVAGALQQAIRNTDFLVRLGGDEFVLLLEGPPVSDTVLDGIMQLPIWG